MVAIRSKLPARHMVRLFLTKADGEVYKFHSVDRPFVCEMYTKGFTTQAHLKEHQNVYTGTKPYSCEVKRKSFICVPDSEKPKRVHRDERPFAYHICDKAFKHESHLADHDRRHRPTVPPRESQTVAGSSNGPGSRAAAGDNHLWL